MPPQQPYLAGTLVTPYTRTPYVYCAANGFAGYCAATHPKPLGFASGQRYPPRYPRCVGQVGLEPTATGLRVQRSFQLSY